MKMEKITTIFANKILTVEIDKTKNLSAGSCWVSYGETVVMANVTMSNQPREGTNFFPLTVEYEEKFYAAGKIPGSFIKREGKPSTHAILVSRCIDRAIRPFFPKDMRNDVCVVATVLSTDHDHSPEICAMIASAIALYVSNIPWNELVLSVNVGLVDNKLILNPTKIERDKSSLNLTISATTEKIAMIEAGAKEISENLMISAIETAHSEIKNLIKFIENNLENCRKNKVDYEKLILPDQILQQIKNEYSKNIKLALLEKDKQKREDELNLIANQIHKKFDEQVENVSLIDECFENVKKKIVRDLIFNENKRVDGRQLNEIRELSCEVNVLPRVHGSAIFSRGLTQTLSVVTLAGLSEEQKLDGLDEITSKRYIHHYNFPPYSVGETKALRGPGRREIGHGSLAERALEAVIPNEDEFPYTIRVVSETLSSNGSTSQASICSSTLALMDAGVPITNPVAGISCGLVSEGDSFKTFVDIQGIEDFYGDMDFKVSGTKKGITAIQVDVKIEGLTLEIIKEVFEKTKKARLKIINEVFSLVQSKPNEHLKSTAPKIEKMKIPVDKIKNVIGMSGKIIQKISSDFEVKINIQDDGIVYILGFDQEKLISAKNYILNIVTPLKIGSIHEGTVIKITDFGAFVEISPGKEGLIHISKLSTRKVKTVDEIVKVGDNVMVKVVEIDSNGKVNLSRKDAISNLKNL